MSVAKRRINSTGRKKITQDSIDLRLFSTGADERPVAKLDLKLDTLKLPPSAAIVVEAYHRSSAMRFDCGTVGHANIPDIFHLTDIEQSSAALFRIKIVDREGKEGKVLASANRLRPRCDENDTGNKSIFPVGHENLGSEIWQLDIDDDAGPKLLLNNRVPGLVHRIHESPVLAGAILPVALRGVLEFLSRNPAEDDDDGPGWKADWLKYCVEKLGIEEDPSEFTDEEDREKWVDNVVRRFCDIYNFADRAKQALLEQVHG